MGLKSSIGRSKYGCKERRFEIKISIRIPLLWQSDIVFVSFFPSFEKINEMENQIVPIQEFRTNFFFIVSRKKV